MNNAIIISSYCCGCKISLLFKIKTWKSKCSSSTPSRLLAACSLTGIVAILLALSFMIFKGTLRIAAILAFPASFRLLSRICLASALPDCSASSLSVRLLILQSWNQWYVCESWRREFLCIRIPPPKCWQLFPFKLKLRVRVCLTI